jgi:oligopeptidase B
MRPQFSSPVTASPPAEPQAEQRPLERTLHDLRLIDEYAWLKAENWREVMRDPFQLDPAIRAYLQAENDYCERALADTKSLQETLFAEMKGRIKEDDSSAPDPDGPYAYYVRYRKEGQHLKAPTSAFASTNWAALSHWALRSLSLESRSM